MPKQKLLSGKQIIRILEQFGFFKYSQNGSHIKMRRMSGNRDIQTLTVPDNSDLRRGMLRKLYSQASKYIPENELEPHFYMS